MKFIMPRNRVLATTMGHTIAFEKGVPAHVPSECYNEVIAVGGVPENELTEEEQSSIKAPEDIAKRKADILAAMEMVATRNTRGDFTAGGSPQLKPLASILGWEIDAKERDALWLEFQQGQAEK